MLKLGLKPGCPKTYLWSGEEVAIGNWTPGDDEILANNFAKAKDLWEVDVTVENMEELRRMFAEEGHQQQQQEELGPEEGMEMDDCWSNYTVGRYNQSDPRLQSPRNIGWSFNQVCQRPSVQGFIKLYHELSLHLPINPLDEIRNRFENPGPSMCGPSKTTTTTTTVVDFFNAGEVRETRLYKIFHYYYKLSVNLLNILTTIFFIFFL